MTWSSNDKNEQSRIEQLLISQEKVPAIIKFKPSTFVLYAPKDFVLPTPKDFVLPKKNHPTSLPSNLGFCYFLLKKKLFSLSKTNLTCSEKGDFFILPFLSSSSFLSTVVVTVMGTTAVATATAASHVVENDATDAAEVEDRTFVVREAC